MGYPEISPPCRAAAQRSKCGHTIILIQLIFAILEICLLSCNWNFVNEIYLTAIQSVCLAKFFRTVNLTMEQESCSNMRQKRSPWQDDGSSVTVFYEFVSKNVSMPTDLGELIAYVLLLVITWYTLLFAFRFLISLVKPVLVVLVALFVFRFLRSFEFEDIIDLGFTILGVVANLVISVVTKFLEFILRFFS